MEQIKESDNVLVVVDNNEEFNELTKPLKAKQITKTGPSFDGFKPEEFNAIIVKNKTVTDHKSLFSSSLKFLTPGGFFIILDIDETVQKTIKLNLTITGYIDIKNSGSSFMCIKPNYQIGSSAKINLKKPETGDVKSVWKLDDTEEDDLIDPDSLLDDEDLKKPDPSSLKVCSTTGKRKACKDCSCGLADELAAEKGSSKIVDTSKGPKSSCGSCYLGDAFRCAECPYLGMPAFKPGEKIQLSDNLLKADI